MITSFDVVIVDPNKTDRLQARCIRRGGRIVVLPPEGYGEQWAGGAR